MDRNSVGTYGMNPVTNYRVYYVMFLDGLVQQYSANII